MKKRAYFWGKKDKPPEDWDKDVLILWEEDDALLLDPTAEKPQAAFERISGDKYDRSEVVATCDLGDGMLYLTRRGWVLGYSPCGGFVGAMIQRER